MFVAFSSSRATRAGTFMFGRVYKIDAKDFRRLEAIKPHLDAKVAKELTEKEAAKARKAGLLIACPLGADEAEAQAEAKGPAAKADAKAATKTEGAAPA